MSSINREEFVACLSASLDNLVTIGMLKQKPLLFIQEPFQGTAALIHLRGNEDYKTLTELDEIITQIMNSMFRYDICIVPDSLTCFEVNI